MNISYSRTSDIGSIFKSFSSRDMKKSYSNLLIQKMRSKKEEIQKMFRVKIDLFQNQKKKSVLTFIQRMKYYLFGPNGLLRKKLKWIRELLTSSDSKPKKRRESLTSQIKVGQLCYYEANENKSSYSGHLKEAKKAAFKRSSNYIVDENYKQNSMYNKFLINAKKRKRKYTTTKSTYLTNLTNTFSRNIFCTNTNQFGLYYTNSEHFTEDNKSRILTEFRRKEKNPYSRPTSSLYAKVNNNELNSKRAESISPRKANVKVKRPSSSHLILSKSLIMRKRLNKTEKIINNKCTGIKIENDINQKKIFRVFSRGNSPPSLKMNTLLCNSWSPKQRYKQPIASQLNSEKKKDLELALDMKIGENPNENYLKVIEKIQKIDDTEYIKTVINLSEGLNKVNEETVMHFSKLIKEDYNKKTCKKKIFVSELSSQIRKRLDSNYNKMQRMLCKFDKDKRNIFS